MINYKTWFMKIIALLVCLLFTVDIFSQIEITANDSSIVVKNGDSTSTFSNNSIYFLHLNKGVEMANNGNFDAAISEFESAQLYNPNDAQLYFNWGLALYFQNNFQESIQMLDRAIAIDNQNEIYFSQRGIAKSRLENFDDAIADFNQALSINSKYSDAYLNLGVTYLQMGLNNNSEKELKHAKQLGNSKAADILEKYF